MKPDANKTVALKSKEKAELYYQTENFGRAFAHFLVAIKLMPEWKDELKLVFTTTLCAWGRQLESKQRFKDLFNCYEQAIEIFPENEEVFCNLGAHLFRLGHLCEAAHYFRQALQLNSKYLPAYRNLQNVSTSLVERWHFRMLNDIHRNEAYREAILKKVRQGFTSVLDIGTGTGILSLYAVKSDAKEVYACDYSPTMCAIASEVLAANKVSNKVKLINKLSNNLKIPGDLPHRVSLVVTETMDAGLLGEHVLQTLLHAWDSLLRPACPQLQAALIQDNPPSNCGVVLPFGARLWAVPVQCRTIADRCYLFSYDHSPWSIKNIWLYSDVDEPYNTENLRSIKDCRFLAEPKLVFTFDFNNPAELRSYYEGKNDRKLLSFFHEERADALAMWFDLLLDEDITISSSPLTDMKLCCWDQAVFTFKKPQQPLNVLVMCGGGKLKCELASESLVNNDEDFISIQSNLDKPIIVPHIGVSTEIIRFINNCQLQDILYDLLKQDDRVKNILDLSPFPMLGFSCMKSKDASLVFVLKTVEEQTAVNAFVKENNLDPMKVKCLLRDEFEVFLSNGCEKFDFIFNNLFEASGELKENCINTIPSLMKMLTPEGTLAPVSLTVLCQLMDCEWISRTSRVVNEELAQTFSIAEFINIYQVSQQLDVDLKNISHTSISEPISCLQLAQTDLALDACRSKDIVVPVVRDGLVNAVPMWFEYQLCVGSQTVSTLSDNTNINQVVFVIDPPVHVKASETVTVNITYHCGVFQLKIIS